METITIPSPTAFLTDSPVLKPASPRPQPAKQRKPNIASKASNNTKKSDGVVKPKQSKSRNGMSVSTLSRKDKRGSSARK